MSTSAVTQQPSIEDKILLATAEASKIAELFSRPIAEAIRAGVAIEPVISGIAKLIAGVFHHHLGHKPAGSTK